MFDFGFPELILIATLGLIFVGPKDIPTVLFKAGRLFRRVKIMMNRTQDAIADVMHELEVDEYRKTMKQDLMDFGSDKAEPKSRIKNPSAKKGEKDG